MNLDQAPNHGALEVGDIKSILIFGLQRSGTNFLESILLKNLRVRVVNEERDRRSPLQKHFRVYDDKNLVPEQGYVNDVSIDSFATLSRYFTVPPAAIVIISKDPYSWYLSYVSWSKKCGWPGCDHHYIEEYNRYYGKFIDMSSSTGLIHFIRYRDLLASPDATLNEFSTKYNVSWRLKSKISLRAPKKVNQSKRFSEKDKAYFLNRDYMKEYSPEDLELLNTKIDWDVAAALGYERE